VLFRSVVERIPFGHKFAVRDIGKGELVLKYGEPIGVATMDIGAGSYVHVHNVESSRGRGDR
jgi:altronate dehydratase small subunit